MRYPIFLPALFLAALLSACDANRSAATQHFDLVAEELPFPRPALASQETLPGARALSEAANKRLRWQRAFFARDFAMLDAALNEAHVRHVTGQENFDEAGYFLDQLEKTQLAGIDACNEWLAAMPESYAANWVCGALWQRGAWAARSGEFAHKVTPIRFALMRERFARSNALLEKASALSPHPVEALTLLAENHFTESRRTTADDLLRKAAAVMPGYARLHQARLHYVQPEWGGSAEKVAEGIEAARQAGVDNNTLLYFHDEFLVRPWKFSDPGAERKYWEKAIAEQPTFHRLKGLASYFNRIENWRDGLPAATRVLEQFPDYAHGYWLRAVAHEKLGNVPEALDDYRMAAALGHDFATQTLIRAHIQGSLGLPARSWSALDAVCRYGAALGSSSAANCMGSMFWEGGRVGGPFRTDVPQAFAWHRFAARGGYHNSQYDLGWLMLTGRAPGVQAQQAKSNGLFWLRRAAEQEHQFAMKKLEEGGYSMTENVGGERALPEQAGGFFQSVFSRGAQ